MKTFFSIVFPVIVLGLCASLIWYVSFRLCVLLGLMRRWPLWTVIAICFMSSIFIMFSGARFTSTFLGILAIVGGYFFCFLVILALLLPPFFMALTTRLMASHA